VETEVHINEEYGYQHWHWIFPGSKADLKTYWDNVIRPMIRQKGCLLHPSELEGEITQVNTDFFLDPSTLIFPNGRKIKVSDLEACCHLHESDDSNIVFKKGE
jgi:hypothetical protein